MDWLRRYAERGVREKAADRSFHVPFRDQTVIPVSSSHEQAAGHRKEKVAKTYTHQAAGICDHV